MLNTEMIFSILVNTDNSGTANCNFALAVVRLVHIIQLLKIELALKIGIQNDFYLSWLLKHILASISGVLNLESPATSLSWVTLPLLCNLCLILILFTV